MNNEERRTFKRIPFDASTQIHQDQQAWSVNLVDLSLKGLLIVPPADWNIDTDKPARANIILNGETRIEMSIRWRHSEQGQVGFECEHIDIDSISHLRRLVELNLADKQLLERELNSLGASD